MNDVYQEVLNEALALHKQGRFDEAEDIYNRLLNRKNFEEPILFLLADLYLRKEYNGLAINLLSNLLQNNPKHAMAWCNLGVGFRKENQYDFAKSAWMRAIEVGGETVEVCSNLAGLYADRAMPDKAIEWCDRALKLDPSNVEAHWQKALATLTMKRWKEGWKLYEYRQKLASWDSRKSINAPLWDGKPVDHLYIHGEQGVGDEVMFASMLPYVTNAKRVTIEVNTKMAALIKQTWPEWTVVTEETPGDYDAKIPIGSLNVLFDKFNEGAYLSPSPERVAFYRAELEKLGPGPYIALTWMGGAKVTRVEDRSIRLEELRPIMDAFTCVSGQYSDTNPMIESERAKAGLHKINDESTGLDLHEQAALFAAVDAVVTVQQTAVHVAGAVGTKTYAMISSHPHWRYGVEGEKLPWYDSVRLFRQKDSWSKVVSMIFEALKNDLGANHA
jgi:hypothetical protein